MESPETPGIQFAHPGRPWQRGSNESIKGLLPQYFRLSWGPRRRRSLHRLSSVVVVW